jgi:hypothetical protein
VWSVAASGQADPAQGATWHGGGSGKADSEGEPAELLSAKTYAPGPQRNHAAKNLASRGHLASTAAMFSRAPEGERQEIIGYSKGLAAPSTG